MSLPGMGQSEQQPSLGKSWREMSRLHLEDHFAGYGVVGA
jgi:hypothetical protein